MEINNYVVCARGQPPRGAPRAGGGRAGGAVRRWPRILDPCGVSAVRCGRGVCVPLASSHWYSGTRAVTQTELAVAHTHDLDHDPVILSATHGHARSGRARSPIPRARWA